MTFFTCITTFFLVFIANGFAEPVVTTKYGQLRGKVVTAPALTFQPPIEVYQFTAIPYATPPVGQLRFKKTAPLQPWSSSGILDSTKQANSCTQNAGFGGGTSSGMSEDCLFLNIWVPRSTLDPFMNSQPLSQQRNSVYVFIHGGGFAMGSTQDSTFNGTYLAAYNNIIVVTVQYRLGSLGFGYLGNEEVPGNMGLWDQVEALKWISENIATFGGNNQEITIGGESAGSVSTSWHLLSPYSRKYFQRAVMESGTAISPWGRNNPEVALAVTNMVFRQICNDTTSASSISARMQCLRSADAKLFPAADKLPEATIYEHILHPVVDGDFMPGDPLYLLLSGNYYKVPILLGANKNEGTMFVTASSLASQLLPSNFPQMSGPPGGFNGSLPLLTSANQDRSIDDLTNEHYFALMYDRFRQYGGEKQLILGTGNPLIIEAIQIAYWPRNHEGTPKGREVFDAVADAFGDYGMLCPTYAWGSTVVNAFSQVYMYHFTQRTAFSPGPDYMGVTHGSELPYVFGRPFAPDDPTSFTNQEKQLSQIMMAYWSNFVKYGDPNGSGSSSFGSDGLMLRKWPSYSGNLSLQCTENYLELNTLTSITSLTSPNTASSVICGLKRRECFLWYDYLPKLAEKLTIFGASNNVFPSPTPSSVSNTWPNYVPMLPTLPPPSSQWWAQQVMLPRPQSPATLPPAATLPSYWGGSLTMAPPQVSWIGGYLPTITGRPPQLPVFSGRPVQLPALWPFVRF